MKETGEAARSGGSSSFPSRIPKSVHKTEVVRREEAVKMLAAAVIKS